MAVHQATIFHLGPCFLLVLLTCGVSSRILQKIDKTAAVGETVVLHCNGSEETTDDTGWRKDGTLLFIYSFYMNQTIKNYTSERMSVDPKHPHRLQISDIQTSDGGTYSCFPSRIQWNLTINDLSMLNKHRIHRVNKTAAVGETVVLHCNGSEETTEDIGWRKDGTLLFIYSFIINQTVKNYTSERMSVDPKHPHRLQISDIQTSDGGTYSCFPSRLQWNLTIYGTVSGAGNDNGPHKKLLYIFTSVTAAIVVLIIILLSVWIHRNWKQRTRKNEVELQQPQGESRQYFERFNSIYGHITS